MTLDEVAVWVKQGESDLLEFKRSTAELQEVGKTLAAFLNGKGGKVFVGVTDQGKVVGQIVKDDTQRQIAQMLERVKPAGFVQFDRIILDAKENREVLIFTAQPQSIKTPAVFDGKPYRRIGSTTSVMPPEEHQRLTLDRAYSQDGWENRKAQNITLEDLDSDEIVRCAQIAVSNGRLPPLSTFDPADILRRLGLADAEGISQAGIVLFGKNFLPFYLQCQIRLAHFKGSDKSEFLDNKQLIGNAFTLFSEGIFFLQRNLPSAAKILSTTLERQDTLLIPLRALREVLVNAFCHRDYSMTGSSVSVGIYQDRVEIWSDGSLPTGLTVESLKAEHPSRPRNPLIAEVFYRRGLVEKWGRGTQEVVKDTMESGLPEPQFVEKNNAFGVIFPFSSSFVSQDKLARLSFRQKEIFHLISLNTTNQGVPLRELHDRLKEKYSLDVIRDDLLLLKNSGLIETKGRGRGALWFLRK